MEQLPQRPAALKVTIHTIQEGVFQQDTQNLPLYLLSLQGEKIYRLNLMATVLNIEKVGSITNVLVDDGTGKIVARFFEESPGLTRLTIGKCVNVIGKARMYNEEKYISPEIIKEISPLWLKVRALELHLSHHRNTVACKEEPIIEEIVNHDPFPHLVKLIKELDRGQGVFVEEILQKSSIQQTEQLLQQMLEKGDVFQVAPGKIKVL